MNKRLNLFVFAFLQILILVSIVKGNIDVQMCSSKNYFARYADFSNQSFIDYLRVTVPLLKALAAFDVSKEIAFFKLEACNGLKLCFVTEFNAFDTEDFGSPSKVLWTKISDAFSDGKKRLTPFQEKHRRLFGRSHIEVNCIDGYFVIQSQPGSMEVDRQPKIKRSTKKQRKKRKHSNRKKDCKSEMCTRTCVGWKYSPYRCVHLRISCEFKCPCRGCRKRGSANSDGKFSEYSSDEHNT